MSIASELEALAANTQGIIDAKTNLAEAVTAKGVDTLPTSSFDTIATNIGLISGGGGLPPVITKHDGGSFTLASDTAGNNYAVNHNLGVPPLGYYIWTNDLVQFNTEQRIIILWCSALNLGIEADSSRNINYTTLHCFRNTNGAIGGSYLSLNALQASSAFTASSFSFPFPRYYKANTTYHWIAWA